MASKKPESSKHNPDLKPQAEKNDLRAEELSDEELRAISGGYEVKGAPPPPKPPPPGFTPF